MTPNEFAINDGYDGADETDIVWNGYKVYEPFFDREPVPVIGLPHSILQKGDELRYTTFEECFEVYDLLCPKNNSDGDEEAKAALKEIFG